jgi:signal transduction histidine kinase
MTMQAIMGTYVLHEHVFACQIRCTTYSWGVGIPSESERTRRLHAVTDAALAHLKLDDLLAELLLRIRDILDADTAAILLLDPDTNELVARAAAGIEEEVEAGVRIPVGRGFAGRVAAERRPILLPDIDHADVLNPILRQKGIKTLLGVPLILEGEPLGVLHIGTLTPRQFQPDEIDLLQLVADRAALAIERARLYDDVVRLDELKMNFVAIASHELRTPATSVYGALATLRARGGRLSPEVRAELEDTAWRESDRMRRLIEQLLDLSRLDAYTVAVRKRPIVLRELLTDIVGESAAHVQLDVDPEVAVVADPMVLEHVISNLLRNALDYGRPPVRIHAEERDRHLRIVVEDHGEGIPEELVPRLFERFARGPVGAGGGLGLGLAIAKEYATAHGGDVIYQPADLGARFELVLPRE